ncbi:carbamoyl-phosphate synthase large subunit [Proteiniborus sp. DW1]|uniref:ATP-grasp domain-containing protein n=1 Tax=Proteiniborus sp. DW1 TaxID=1889883 RepID=UPI00092E0E9C|nr:ATP-grasp domain-containing protein [Proteiniborus sp. DW1]SCG81918.1 carbamoyl-phosphate synthase large subunit [Proteiniborus sp. DW1]
MRILLTAIGKRVQLIKHLKKINYVVGVDSGDLAPAKFFVDSFFKVPPCNDKEYVNVILSICKNEKIDMLIPLYEKEFLILDSNRHKFKEVGTFLLLSDSSVLEICNDKWNTFNFFKENNINTPKTYLLEEIKENQNITISYPVIIKPRDGMGSRGIFYANNRDELLHTISSLSGYIIQEKVEGTEYTLDIFCDFDGQVISIVPRQRLEVRAGEVSKSKAVKDIRLIDVALNLVNKLNSSKGYKAIGPMNIQCIVDKNGEIKFIEINPRFGGGVPLSFEAGVDYGQILCDLISGKKIEPFIGGFEELTMLRFDDAVYIK